MRPKVLILVVCAVDKRGEYEMLSDTIKDTWGQTETEHAKIHYLWANNYKTPQKNDYVLNEPESYGALLWKTIGFLEKNIDMDFDYIFRTNIGSYVHTKRIVDWLQDCPRKGFYSGICGSVDGIEFCSGSGFFLSKDLCKLAVENKKHLGRDHIDDVSFGRFFTKFDIKRSPKCMRITSHYDGRDERGLILQIDEEVIPEPLFPYEKNYHWRLRSSDGQRIKDAEEMRRLYKQFNP